MVAVTGKELLPMNKRRRFKIYPAGPMRGKNELGFLHNLELFARATAEVFKAGFTPFPVCGDWTYLAKVSPPPRIEDIHEASASWIEDCDAMLMLEGWEHSQGAMQERKIAERHSIPVFFSLAKLTEWADQLIEAEAVDPIRAAEEILARGDD